MRAPVTSRSHFGCGIFEAHAFRREREDSTDVVFGTCASRVSGDDDRHLAEDVVGTLRELPERSAAHLLVVFRELAAQRGGAVGAKHLGHARQPGIVASQRMRATSGMVPRKAPT